jgi:hypothetical protein
MCSRTYWLRVPTFRPTFNLLTNHHREHTATPIRELRRYHCTEHSYIPTSRLSIKGSYYTGIRTATPGNTLAGTMEEQGKLTKSGLLYEGNYQEWEDRLMIMLEVLGTDSDRPDELGNGVRIAHLIKSLVIPRLSLLIKPGPPRWIHDFTWREHLLPLLKLAAMPFRLMKMPVSVRTLIWKFAIASQQGPIRYSITADSPFGNERLHPVTRVSREVRAETLALAWVNARVRFRPSVSTLRCYRGERFSSRYANRFHQLDAFEQSNGISGVSPVYAVFPLFEKGRPDNCGYLMLAISRSSSNRMQFYHKQSGHTGRLVPSAMRKIESHLDLASRVFSSSRSSTAMAAMALLGAPSLWEESNLECEWKPMKPTGQTSENPEVAIC